MQQNEIIDKIKLFRYSEKSIGVGGLKTREQRLYFQEHIKPKIKHCRYQPSGPTTVAFYIFPLSSILDAVVAMALAGIEIEANFTYRGEEHMQIKGELLKQITNCGIQAVEIAIANNIQIYN